MLEIGCDDYVAKPFVLNDLLLAIGDQLGVEYVYNQPIARPIPAPPAPTIEAVELSAASLSIMPIDWQMALGTAACNLNPEQCRELLNHIPDTHADLAHTLHQWVDNFRFDLIRQLTQSH